MGHGEDNAGSCRVLVVDDNDGVRNLVRMMLADDPHIEVVAEAIDGAQGIATAADCAPDVIILDINMPVMDGFTALPRIRSVAPHAAIVIWTASAPEDGVEQRALDLGADAFIPKAGLEPLAILEFIRGSCRSRSGVRGVDVEH